MAPGALLAPRKTCSVCKTRRAPARRKNHILAPFPSISYFNAYYDDDGEPPVNSNELYVRRHSSVDYVERFDEFLEQARETEDVKPDFPEALYEDIWRF